MGRTLFNANWTVTEGGGRPLSKGTGDPIRRSEFATSLSSQLQSDLGARFEFLREVPQRPYPGGGGDIVAYVFVLGQRFDWGNADPVTGNRTTL
jgi:hypothetical protein